MHAAQTFSGVEEIQRAAQGRLVVSHQRFVGEDASLRPGDNRLLRHPHGRQRVGKTLVQADAIQPQALIGLRRGQRLPARARHAVRPQRQADGVLQDFAGHRLDEIAEGAVVQRAHGALQRRGIGQQDHRHVFVALAHRGQQAEAVELGQGHVADDDVERLVLHQTFGRAPVIGDGDVVPGGGQQTGISARGQWVIVHNQHVPAHGCWNG